MSMDATFTLSQSGKRQSILINVSHVNLHCSNPLRKLLRAWQADDRDQVVEKEGDTTATAANTNPTPSSKVTYTAIKQQSITVDESSKVTTTTELSENLSSIAASKDPEPQSYSKSDKPNGKQSR